MISAQLIELVEIHARQLVSDVARDLVSSERTRGFRSVPLEDLEHRLFQIVHRLGDWIGESGSEHVRTEFSEWGARRFDQQIPLSEIVYAVILLKQHLHRYVREHGIVEASFPRIDQDYVLPMHLHSLQELNNTVGRFFDEALYYLASGYEAEASRVRAGVAAASRPTPAQSRR
jgi:hypothetical protein